MKALGDFLYTIAEQYYYWKRQALVSISNDIRI